MADDLLDAPPPGGMPTLPGGGAAYSEAFLQAIFGADYLHAYVASFPGDPSAGGSREWAGGLYERQRGRLAGDHNQYVVVSTFQEEAGGVVRRRADKLLRCYAIMVDDVGPNQKIPIADLPDHGASATAVVETSEGNFQLWYALGEELSAAEVETLQRSIALKYAVAARDPGMMGVTRYGRLPAGINGKPTANRWPVRLTALRPNRRFTYADIIHLFELGQPEVEEAPSHHLVLSDDKLGQLEDIRQSFVDAALAADLGPRQRSLDPDKYDLTCPWIEDHTGRAATGTIMKLPSLASPTYYFKCHHGHCEGRRIGDLINWLAEKVPSVPVLSPKTLEFDPVDEVEIERVTAPRPPRPAVLSRVEGVFRSIRQLGYRKRTEGIPPLVAELGIPQDAVSVLAGPPGAGKSYFTLQLATSIATGIPFMGNFDVVPGRVLMVVGEDRITPDGPVHLRMQTLFDSLMMTEEQAAALDENLFFATINLPRSIAEQIAAARPNLELDSEARVTEATVNEVQEEYRLNLQTAVRGEVQHPAGAWRLLTREVIRTRPKILILDPKVAIDLSNENDNAHQATLMSRLDQFAEKFGIAILIVHHTTKAVLSAEELSQEQVRGASAIIAGARHAMMLVPMSAKVAKELQYDEVNRRRRLLLEVVKASYAATTRHIVRYVYGEPMNLDSRRLGIDVPDEDQPLNRRVYQAVINNGGRLPNTHTLRDALRCKRNVLIETIDEMTRMGVLIGTVRNRVLADDHAERFAAMVDDLLA